MKYNFKEFERDFPNDDACLEFVFWNRWPDGGTCECGKVNSFSIFHKSETSLSFGSAQWFGVMAKRIRCVINQAVLYVTPSIR